MYINAHIHIHIYMQACRNPLMPCATHAHISVKRDLYHYQKRPISVSDAVCYTHTALGLRV